MKKTDIRSSKAVNEKATYTTLTKEQLHNTGRAFGGIRFWIGDVLVFPDWDELDTQSDIFVDAEKKEHSFPVVKIGLNDTVRFIPIGSFRRFAAGIEEYVEKYAKLSEFHRNLTLAQDDFELLQLFAGHTFEIKEFFDARMIAWTPDRKRVPYNKDDVKTFTTMRWPVFTIVE